jgi:hypothetical protein
MEIEISKNLKKSERVEQVRSLEDQAVFALTELLRLYLAGDFRAQKMFRQKEFPNDSLWSCAAIFEVGKMLPAHVRVASHLLEEPVRWALRDAMTKIGKVLYAEAGSTALMSKVLYRVEGIFELTNQGGRAAGVLDHAFDGIGDWFA